MTAAKLSYDSATDRYTLVVKTDKRWAGTCRTLELLFADRSPSVYAVFDFRK